MTWKPVLLATAAAALAAGCTTPQHHAYGTRDVHVVRMTPGTSYAFATPRGHGSPRAFTMIAPPAPPAPPRPFAMFAPPPPPPIPPLPPAAYRNLDETIAAARARGDKVIDRNENGRRTVIITGPGTNIHIVQDNTPEGRARAKAAREAGRMAREAGRAAREAGARARAEGARARLEGLRAGEEARRYAFAFRDAPNVTVMSREEIDRLTRDARAGAEQARRQAEALRPQIDEIRRNAQRLREQCERGEIKCEIIITEPGRP